MTILVAAANDSLRERVVTVAVDLGHELNEELHVVHLVDDSVSDADVARFRASLEERLATAPVVSTITIQRLDYAAGRPRQQIGAALADLAAEDGTSHIVVGHESKELVETLTKGNTAFAVADMARVPVTVVPAGNGEPPD
ncbi:universal stress protein [Salinirubrum litoreum]|uniref:Universal stress protein n=1 Tax=Salinirubrum litoreum TaxID=1126234 RepID=A0ABD5RBS3_9EURY|nr:universal stress protein [Salinirubrum litoreum]